VTSRRRPGVSSSVPEASRSPASSALPRPFLRPRRDMPPSVPHLAALLAPHVGDLRRRVGVEHRIDGAARRARGNRGCSGCVSQQVQSCAGGSRWDSRAASGSPNRRREGKCHCGGRAEEAGASASSASGRALLNDQYNTCRWPLRRPAAAGRREPAVHRRFPIPGAKTTVPMSTSSRASVSRRVIARRRSPGRP
jgi:hypothetical protein